MLTVVLLLAVRTSSCCSVTGANALSWIMCSSRRPSLTSPSPRCWIPLMRTHSSDAAKCTPPWVRYARTPVCLCPPPPHHKWQRHGMRHTAAAHSFPSPPACANVCAEKALMTLRQHQQQHATSLRTLCSTKTPSRTRPRPWLCPPTTRRP
jgi:hypothetical protein